MEGPFREVSCESGFAGAGNAKIDVEDMGMLWAEKREQKKREIDQGGENEQSHLYCTPFGNQIERCLGGGARTSLRAPSPHGLTGAGAGRPSQYLRRRT